MPFKYLEVLSPCIRHIHHTLRNSLTYKLFPALKYLREDGNTGDDGDTLTDKLKGI